MTSFIPREIPDFFYRSVDTGRSGGNIKVVNRWCEGGGYLSRGKGGGGGTMHGMIFGKDPLRVVLSEIRSGWYLRQLFEVTKEFVKLSHGLLNGSSPRRQGVRCQYWSLSLMHNLVFIS